MELDFDSIDFEQAEKDAAARVEQIDEQNSLEASADDNDCGDACKI